MKYTLLKTSILFSVLIGLSGCSVDSFDQNSSALTSEESLIAGQIIGESVSENQNGLLSSFSEAFAIPAESNLINGPSLLSSDSFRNLEDYTHEFNDETGTHLVTFSKNDSNVIFSSSTTYTLQYIFYDGNKNIIEFPDQKRNEIEAVEYSATRTGEIQSNSKVSFFTRTDRLFIDGLSTESMILTIDGFHSGEGIFTQIRANGNEVKREYLLDINYLDINIDKSVVQNNRNFRKGINGALSYESTVRQVNGNNPDTKTVNGTIELNGDGTALLKFREQFDTFRLRLENGEVFDKDEFEGRITKVDLQNQIFTISNGQRIQINERTEIEDGDFTSLEEVANALESNVKIIAEGDYFQPDENINLWISTELELELETDEFEDLVKSVNVNQQSFTLSNGDVFFITDMSDVDFDNGFESLEDVANAVELGMPVEAEGDFFIDVPTGQRIVKGVDFESELDEFGDHVSSVDVSEQRFTLINGDVIQITDETIINPDGDYLTLEEVAEALDNDTDVEAGGSYYLAPSGNYWIAVKVEFEN